MTTEPNIQPTPEDMSLDIRDHLAALDQIDGDTIACRFYTIKHHRAAIRRALAAEAVVMSLGVIPDEATASLKAQREDLLAILLASVIPPDVG